VRSEESKLRRDRVISYRIVLYHTTRRHHLVLKLGPERPKTTTVSGDDIGDVLDVDVSVVDDPETVERGACAG